MNRDYNTGVRSDVSMFTGIEVEHTPAYGMKTLFVVGIQDSKTIVEKARSSGCEHIYLGANQSFDPGRWENGDHEKSDQWNKMIFEILNEDLLTTLDFDVKHCSWVLESGFCEKDHFIPQISVKLPYLRLFNYNTMLKIDDTDFKASNPGVWCHRLHDLQDHKVFTPWTKYKGDSPL
jgi:hypothetical protein